MPVRQFDQMKTEWGYSQLLSLEIFNISSNDYLVQDSCIIGAEVSVNERPVKWEQLSMVVNPTGRIITWKIGNFSKLSQKYRY